MQQTIFFIYLREREGCCGPTEGESFETGRSESGEVGQMWDKKKRRRVSVIFPPSHASSAMHRYIMQKKQLRYCFLWTRWPPRAFYFLFSMPEKPDNFSLILSYLSVCLLPYGFQNKCILFISPLLVFERISAHHSKTSEAFLGDYAIFIARHDFPRKTMSAGERFSPRELQRK